MNEATRAGGPSRIAVISQFYAPEPCAAANRVTALCEALRDAGHEVTVVTAFPTFPSNRLAPGDRGAVFRRERHDGIAVERVWTPVAPVARGARALTWAAVAVGATLRLLFTRRRYDVVVVSSPPITLALPALLAAARHRARLVVDVRDVFPEIGVTMGIWSEGSLIVRLLRSVAGVLYRRAGAIAATTPTQVREIAAYRISLERIHLAPNGYDRVVPQPVERESGGRCVVAFAGNVGLATGFDVVAEAMARLAGDPDFAFVVVGDGADLPRVRQRLEALEARNVRFAGVLARAQALGTLQSADVAIVPLRPEIRESLPTKIFDALAMGCPVVLSAAGEARRFVERSGGGVCVTPGDADELVRALRTLAADAALRRELGARGRRYVLERCERSAIMGTLAAAIAPVPA